MNNDTHPAFDNVLALHPTKHGFAWVLFNGPLSVVEWGRASVSARHNHRAIERVKDLIARFRPTEVVLEQFQGTPARRVQRIRALCRGIVKLARYEGIEPRIFSRELINSVFAPFKVKDRYGIARVIANHIEPLSHLLPPKRKIWDAEDARMSVFCAAALAITFFVVVNGAAFAD